MTVRGTLTTVLTEEFDVDGEVIDHATLDDLGLDSISVVELLDTLSKRLNIPLADDDMNKQTTIATALEILTTRSEAAD